jgi:hypothetical protein
MDDDIIDVNCGRCGRPLRVRLSDLMDNRTVECSACTPFPGGEGNTRSPAAGPAGVLGVLRVPVRR